MTVEPASTIEQIRPGATITVPIELTNSTATTLRVETGAVAGTGARDGDALVTIAPHAPTDATRNPSSWLRFPEHVIVLAANAHRTVQVRVTAPAGARPGTHVALATFSVPTTSAGHGATGVSGRAGIATALLLDVAGDARSSARIVSTSSPAVTHGGRTLEFSALVENTGDRLLRLDGEVRLDAPWGAQRKLRADEQLLLPGGTREIAMRLDDPPIVGRYSPKLVVVGGAGSGVRLDQDLTTLWILPPWWLVGAVVAATALAVAGALARRRWRVSR